MWFFVGHRNPETITSVTDDSTADVQSKERRSSSAGMEAPMGSLSGMPVWDLRTLDDVISSVALFFLFLFMNV